MSELPSGPWTGFYSYAGKSRQHRMNLVLEVAKGRVTGEGTDDVGPFFLAGRYDPQSNEVHWSKTYVSAHTLFYTGIRGGRGIQGTWERGVHWRGGFRIWPLASGEIDGDEETEKKEEVEPVDAVGELVGAGATDAFRGRGPIFQTITAPAARGSNALSLYAAPERH